MRIDTLLFRAALILFLGIVVDLHAQAPIKYTISLIERNFEQNTLIFKTKIKNISDSDVVIDKHGNSFLDVEKRPRTTYANSSFELSGGSMSIIADGHTADYLTLPPGGTYWDKRVLPLSSSNIFEKGGRYSICFRYETSTPFTFEGRDVWIGTVKSNTIKFGLNSKSTRPIRRRSRP